MTNFNQLYNYKANWNNSYSTLYANSANYILDGGNTKGADISIGTNDAYNLSFETNAIPRLLITSDTLSGNTSKTSFGAGFATGIYSLAEGSDTLASGNYSHAEGQDSNASGESSHAEGFDNATGRRNDFLTYTAATRTFTFANTLSANFSYVSNGTVLRGFENSTLNGHFTITIASRDTGTGAISATADAIGANSSSGYLIDNKGSWAHAEGYGNTATGEDSHAEGYNNTASGDDSHAEGFDNTSSGLRSHAEGVSNKASGDGSHAQGNNTIASGEYSHTQGAGTLASGSRSTATGQFTSATKVTSYASGRLALADHSRSWVWQGTNQEGVSAQFTSTRTDQFAIRPTNGFFLSGAMGIGTDSIANALTVVGTISTIEGNSNQWNSTYTSLNTNSGKYESVYTTTKTNSAKYESTYTSLNANSGKYESTYNNVSTLSGNGTFNLYARGINLASTVAWISAVDIPANINLLTGGGVCLTTDIACIIKSRTLSPTNVGTTGVLFSTPPSFGFEDTSGNSHASSLSIGAKPLSGNYSRTSNGVGVGNSNGKFTYNGGAARIVSSTLPVFLTANLSLSVNNITTILPLTGSGNSAFSGNDFHVKVDNEIMYVSSGGSSASMTVARGQLGTTAATHLSGALVTANVGLSSMLLIDACFTMKRFESF